jgi:ketosteroid isomerase-like protein
MSGWNRLGMVVIGVILALSSTSARQQKKDDEAAVRDTVKEYVAARDRGDATALSGLFTADADQLVSSGEWRRGREELVRGTLASSKSNAGTRTITLKTVRSYTGCRDR